MLLQARLWCKPGAPGAMADGTDLARHVPDGSTELGLLFDAMGAAAPGGEAGR